MVFIPLESLQGSHARSASSARVTFFFVLLSLSRLFCLQIYFLPDPFLSSIPFSALKVGKRFLIERALVAQASSLRTLDCARIRWDAICSEPQPSSSAPEVGLEECRDENKMNVYLLACLWLISGCT